jgi:hypothetical protein
LQYMIGFCLTWAFAIKNLRSLFIWVMEISLIINYKNNTKTYPKNESK